METVGWTMAEIEEFSSTIVQYRINLIEEIFPTWDPQHRLNLIMKKAVRKDILKCLDDGIIYTKLCQKNLGSLQSKLTRTSWFLFTS